MKTIFFAFAFIAYANCACSRGIPDYLKRNWIAIIKNPDDKTGFDTLLLYPDNDKIDTSRLFYCYWVHHTNNKFFLGYFDKRSPGNELANGNYEKWDIRKKNVLRIKNCKTKSVTFHKVFVCRDNNNKILSLMLLNTAGRFRDW